MSFLIALAARSAWNRRYTLGLTMISIALAACLLLGIERLRSDVRASFSQSVSGTDLIVGARGSPVELMLYAVFRMGQSAYDISWKSAQRIAEHKGVAWAVPLALGDSHRGFPVMGTTPDYFKFFRYGDRQALRFASGQQFDGIFGAVVGAEVASRLGYRVGSQITLSHGSGILSPEDLPEHADKPFRVVGVLARTGTPVDNTVHISLAGMQAIHLEWQGGVQLPGFSIPADMVKKFDLTPKSLTAVMVGLKRRSDVFAMQREVRSWRDEPLMAVMPGVALDQLWEVVSIGERALLLVSALVAVVGLAGLTATILSGLDARRRELAILRSVGARPRELLCLLALEGLSITVLSVVLGVALLTGVVLFFGPALQARFGVVLTATTPSPGEIEMLAWIVFAGFVASLLPGIRAYRLSLADGLTPRT